MCAAFLRGHLNDKTGGDLRDIGEPQEDTFVRQACRSRLKCPNGRNSCIQSVEASRPVAGNTLVDVYGEIPCRLKPKRGGARVIQKRWIIMISERRYDQYVASFENAPL